EQRTLSASTVHRLTFRDSVRQFASFALISSRVTFWLWLVSCDGFHVPQWFLRELPLITLIYDERILNALAEKGRQLWSQASATPVVSVNAGKTSLTFRQHQDAAIKAEID